MANLLNPKINYSGKRLSRLFAHTCIEKWGKRDLNPAFFEKMTDDVVNNVKKRDQKDNPLVKTLYKLGEQMGKSADHPYHGRMHLAHVPTFASYLYQRAGIQDNLYLLGMIAAYSHDLAHPGKPNPKDKPNEIPPEVADPVKNERMAADIATEIMKGMGCAKRDIAIVRGMIFSTSPNGPKQALIEWNQYISKPIEQRDVGEADKIRGKMNEEQQALLGYNEKVWEAACILCDADIFGSAGLGERVNKHFSKQLNKEGLKNNDPMDYEAPSALLGFLNYVVGPDGFASKVAKQFFNTDYRELKASAQHKVAL